MRTEPSPFQAGEPRIRVVIQVEGNWDEAAVAERRKTHEDASTSGAPLMSAPAFMKVFAQGVSIADWSDKGCKLCFTLESCCPMS